MDTETDRPVHKVNYCVAMSACDKCTYDYPCKDGCQTQTFSGLRGRDALKDFACGRLMTRLTWRPHNSSNYDSHAILSYLVENTEYPELLDNGGNVLQMYIKACESMLLTVVVFCQCH